MSAADPPTVPLDPQTRLSQRREQLAEAEITTRPLRLRARVRVTPAGILAIGGLLSGLMLSTAVLVWAATSAASRRAITERRRRH